MIGNVLIGAALMFAPVSGHAPPAPAKGGSDQSCTLAPSDRAWIDKALAAWRYSSRHYTGIKLRRPFEGIFYDAHCTLSATNALSLGKRTPDWMATPHDSEVVMPDGSKAPVQPTSFASANGSAFYFVMSVPSVWRAGGVENKGIGLETMMVAVLLHEGSHVAQFATYGDQIGRISDRYHLPQDFNDDSMQVRFAETPEFAASITRETGLLFAAAEAKDRATTLRLAKSARAQMRSRAQRYFVGADAYYGEAEDFWLTMEGSGQWAGFTWIIDPKGGGFARDVAMTNFAKRSKWWSQNEGLALFLVLDRLAPNTWQRTVFGDGSKTALQLLDAELS